MRPLSTAMALVTCGALLAGCGGSPEASPAPTPSPTESANPGPSPTPSAALNATGAEQFARAYISALNLMQRTGNTREIRRLEAPDCESCQAVRSAAATIYKAGGSIRGGTWSVDEIFGNDPSQNGRVLSLVISFGPQQLRRQAGGEVEELDGGGGPMTLELIERGDTWAVSSWTRGS